MNLLRLVGLGGLGAAGGLLLLYLGLVFVTIPNSAGGMNLTTALVTWISAGVVIAGLIAPHVVYSLILLRMAKDPRPELP